MSASSFDPAGSVRFDFSTGAVSLEGEGRAVFLPEGVLEALLTAAGAAGHGALRKLGSALGEAARAGLASDATPEDALHRAAGSLGRAGLGRVSMETWGPALAVQLEGAPAAITGDAARALLEGLFSGMVGREVALVTVDGRHLVVAPGEREAIASRAASAKGVAEVVSFLAEGGAA